MQLQEVGEIRGWGLKWKSNNSGSSVHYKLSLPPAETAGLDREMRYLHEMLKSIGRATNIPTSQLLARAETLRLEMAESGDYDLKKPALNHSWKGLEFQCRSYHAPYTERVLFRILSELHELSIFTADEVKSFVALLTTRDRYFISALPETRPGWIEPYCANDEKPRPYEEEWRDAVVFKSPPSRVPKVVLASHMHSQIPTENHPREFQMLMSENNRFPIELIESLLGFPFAVAPSPRVEDYLVAASLLDVSSLIVASSPSVDSPAHQWLAINPRIAIEYLGWEISPDKPFTWQKRGVMMVQSVWWQDGQPSSTSTSLSGVSSRGWAVIASESGRRELEENFGKFSIREWRQRSQQRSHSHVSRGRVFMNTK